jgi:hypothetical protein
MYLVIKQLYIKENSDGNRCVGGLARLRQIDAGVTFGTTADTRTLTSAV